MGKKIYIGSQILACAVTLSMALMLLTLLKPIYRELTVPGTLLDGNIILNPIKISTNILIPFGLLVNIITLLEMRKHSVPRYISIVTAWCFCQLVVATLFLGFWLFKVAFEGRGAFSDVVWWL
jgi:hypothetical protein